MIIKLENLNVFINNTLIKQDLYLENGIIRYNLSNYDRVIKGDYIVIPGITDLHTHLRERGFEYKETISTANKAALKGGVNTVFAMPNLNPTCDSLKTLKKQEEIYKEADIKIKQFVAITKKQEGKELTDIDNIAKYNRFFSDDGKGVQSEAMMFEAMKYVAKNNGIISAHCEDESELTTNACIHLGKKSKEFNLIGISSKSEYLQIERDLKLAKLTKCHYHVDHISTRQGVDLVRKAKSKGIKVTAEVTPHHLLLSENDIKENDGKYKMNPPLRSEEDRIALIQGIIDGTIDVIATDHAPHSKKEKETTFDKAKFGVVGIEFAFDLLYENLVKKKIITLSKLIQLMTINPTTIFNLESNTITEGKLANIAIFDLNSSRFIRKETILSKGKSTCFEGRHLSSECVMNIIDGEIKYEKENLNA